jgi:hypothetical protein
MISAKEEAIELVDEYYNFGYLKLDYEQAKQCALLTVNQLIKVTGSKHYYDVKKELEKL